MYSNWIRPFMKLEPSRVEEVSLCPVRARPASLMKNILELDELLLLHLVLKQRVAAVVQDALGVADV